MHFVYLHSVFRDEEVGFRALLAKLAETHSFVSYGDAVERVRNGPIDEPIIAFSFDDGLKSCLVAARILGEFGAKACFFVCSSVIDEPSVEALRAFCRDRLHVPPVEFLGSHDIESLLAAGHEIGSHTRTHANLAASSDAEVVDELEGAKSDLTARFGPILHFAWPYGRFAHVRPGIARAVARAGYLSCASAERGCHTIPAGDAREAICLRRDQVVAAWPLSHSLHFLARSARRSCESTNGWPPELASTTEGACHG